MSLHADQTARKLVFLHIPKTAGQAVHQAIAQAVGAPAISPVRVHSQAGRGRAQFPPGYRVYSGHIDWESLEMLGPGTRTFTVLRDPLERIASFYFYLRRKASQMDASALEHGQHTGLSRALRWSAEAYFFGGDKEWRRFIADHYRAPYCSYLVTRRIRGHSQIAHLLRPDLISRAVLAARQLDGVYDQRDLGTLEVDLSLWLGTEIRLTEVNRGPGTGPRWPDLAAVLSPDGAARLADWVAPDQALMARLGLAPPKISATPRGAAA
ncbi:sulfotransferase family 2 domain-containing protein [Roseivivax sp. THAF30]|uniref:sulfotransferase family 2 domain-containing protein n=1 Tax=Roseivivax sp. THAF30 TaxID=2587852 RepID=UPI0012689528|nr:sulfotransferase family 2 domain-containing protein [Roseivivax sp. THAF30]QFT61374.1 Sulfotransferase family protein [Roseivivax sp. THAF30]